MWMDHTQCYNKAFPDRDIICVDNGIYKTFDDILNNLPFLSPNL